MGLALCEIDPAHKRKLHQEQLEIDQANGDTEGIASALWYIGLVDCQEAEWEQAFQTLKASLAHFRRVHNPNMLGMVSVWLAICSVYNGDLPRAGQCLNEAMNVYSELGNESGVATCWWLRSCLNISEGLFPQAAEAIEQAWRINQGDAASILAIRARLARLQGEADQAQQLAQEGLKISRELQSTNTDILLELGYQALECDDLPGAAAYWREGVQHLIRTRAPSHGKTTWMGWLCWRRGRARWNWQRACSAPAGAVVISTCFPRPSAPFGLLSRRRSRAFWGRSRFAQLSQEGQAMTFMQMLAAVREFLSDEICYLLVPTASCSPISKAERRCGSSGLFRRWLPELPERIETLEADQAALTANMATLDLYR